MKISSSFLYSSLLFATGLLIGSIITSGLNGRFEFCIGLYVSLNTLLSFQTFNKTKTIRKDLNFEEKQRQNQVRYLLNCHDHL